MVRRGVVLVPERRQVFEPLTVEENLILGSYATGTAFRLARSSPLVEERLASVFTLFPVLAERRTQLAGTLSGGEQQMLAIGRALMAGPRLLMLDEPSLGLAPRIVAEIMRALADLRDAGTTILLVEQATRGRARPRRPRLPPGARHDRAGRDGRCRRGGPAHRPGLRRQPRDRHAGRTGTS